MANEPISPIIDRALALWLYAQQTRPSDVARYIGLYGNPFTPWPPDEARIAVFLARFPGEVFRDSLGDAELEAKNTIDPKKRQELIETFNREYEEVKAGRVTAEKKSKQYTQALIEKNKKSPLVAQISMGPKNNVPLTKDRLEKVVRQTLEKPIKSEEKTHYFQTLETLATIHPDVDVSILAQRAMKVAALADVFVRPTEGDGPIQKPNFFSSIRDQTLDKGVVKSLENIFTKTQLLTDVFGKDVTNQLWFQQAITHSNGLIGGQRAAARVGNILSSVISDVGASVFRGPPDETMIAYLELWHLNVIQGLPPVSFSQFRFNILTSGAQIVETGTTAAHWGGWIKTIFGGLSTAGKAAAAGGTATTAGGGLLASVGGPWGLLALVGGWAFGKAKGVAGKLVNMVRGGPVPGDRIILITIIVVLGVYFIGLGPLSLFNFAESQQDMADSSLFTNFHTGGAEVGGEGLPPYAGSPSIPSDITGCPTQNRYILTQCPGGSYSHGGLYAYDLAIPMGNQVLATHDGVVAVTTNTAQSGGYGNMVEIKGITIGGTHYYTLYGHLSFFAVKPGQQVRKGHVIGYSDNTGNSSGSHLHYEYRDGSNVGRPNYNVQFLPAGCTTNPGYCALK